MKKALFVLFAFISVLFVSCEKEQAVVDTPEVSVEKEMYTLTVNASKDIDSKALAADGTTTWAANEKVLVFKAGKSTSIGVLYPQSYGLATALLRGTVDFTGISVDDKLDLVFIGKDSNSDNAWTYEGQVGTLADISNNFDYAKATVTVNTKTDNATASTTDADFVNQQCIVKFTLKNADGSASISASRLAISAASGRLVTGYKATSEGFVPEYGDIIVTPDTASDEIYVALRNDKGSADTYILTATQASNNDTYRREQSGVNFIKGTLRSITVRMTKANVYTVVGDNVALLGGTWNPTLTANDMVELVNGTYRKEYSVGSTTTYHLKVVKNRDWDKGTWPGTGNDDYKSVSGFGLLIVTFDPSGNSGNGYMDAYFESTYTLAGTLSEFGGSWDPSLSANDMVKLPNGIYEKSYTVSSAQNIEYKVCKDHGWSDAYPGSNATFEVLAAGTLHFAFNTKYYQVTAWMGDPVYSVAGSFNSWNASANEMVKQQDGTYKCTVNGLAAGTYTFKTVLNGDLSNWNWGADGDFMGADCSYTLASSGDILFTFDPTTGVTTAEAL